MLLNTLLDGAGFHGAFVPLSIEKEAHGTSLFWSDIILVCVETQIGEVTPQLIHELLCCQSIETLNDSVIVENFQVVARVNDRHEIVEVFLTSDSLTCVEGSLLSNLADIVCSS